MNKGCRGYESGGMQAADGCHRLMVGEVSAQYRRNAFCDPHDLPMLSQCPLHAPSQPPCVTFRWVVVSLDNHPFLPSHVVLRRCILSADAAGALTGVVSEFAEPVCCPTPRHTLFLPFLCSGWHRGRLFVFKEQSSAANTVTLPVHRSEGDVNVEVKEKGL